jgi:hypothetical protein
LIRTLLEAKVIVLAALQGEGLDPATLTEQELLAEIERAAKDLRERDSFEPFLYRSGDTLCLPFFSSSKHAETFCGEYAKERNRVFPFQTLTIRGPVLASLLPAADVLVLDPKTADEYVLSDADKRLLVDASRAREAK